MKEITIRDFQRNLTTLLRDEIGFAVTRNGVNVGYWFTPAEYEDTRNRVRQAEERLKVALEGQVVSDIKESVSDTIEQEPNTDKPERCKVCNCKIYTVWYSGTYWNEGEDMALDICALCYKKHKPKGFKKHEPTVPKRSRR